MNKVTMHATTNDMPKNPMNFQVRLFAKIRLGVGVAIVMNFILKSAESLYRPIQ
jgi:hypothetical protein